MNTLLLTKEDFQLAIEIVDIIVDSTDVNNIENILKQHSDNFDGYRKKQFLVHINNLLLNVMLNELDWRCDSAFERANEGRKATNRIIKEMKK